MSREGIRPYDSPAGGWDALAATGRVVREQGAPATSARALLRANQPDGFDCPGCAWPDPKHTSSFEFCENGAKAVAWETTSRTVDAAFFARHTVAELRAQSDHWLEAQGRLATPLRYERATDRYVPIEWDAAFARIGEYLRRLPTPDAAAFYTSGRTSNEAAFLYQLFAREFGTNNLPDCSNLCHEATSVGLPESIGVGKGTVQLEDFERTALILSFGHNPGTNHPRMLATLRAAAKRGVPLLVFNPLRERGLERFRSPQHPLEMLGGGATELATHYFQPRIGSDTQLLQGLMKQVLVLDAIDREFVAAHTTGLEALVAQLDALDWSGLCAATGLTREQFALAGSLYAAASTAIVAYGMGITQHVHGTQNVQQLANLLLLRGNIGRRGAGICPVRGHSNVQGQRTVGITEKPELVPLDRIGQLFDFHPPREPGITTVDACKGVCEGKVRAFVSLGGNFVRAVPETSLIEPAWRRQRLTVQIATKLNRSHLIHGEISYLLPCLGRIEIDRQASGPQAVSMEDSTGCMHGSRGIAEPIADQLRSEIAIVAGIAKATLPPNPQVRWDAWTDDYGLVRDEIAKALPETFYDFNRRLWEPGGFHRKIPAAERVWKTPTGKANFAVPEAFDADPDMQPAGGEVLRLMTLRSNDQFNTTVYGYDDRFRGIRGTRMVILMNAADIARMGLADGEHVTVSTVAEDGVRREVPGLRVTAYDVPEGCCGAYYPEVNVLIPLWHHAKESKVPAAKAVPVRIRRELRGAA
jgi:molybdopterin-dependent oxidoreductase alpha subunit